ncbi:MAG: magnesium transporter CorA family protein [Pseudomonadota bacterium]
MLHVYSTVDGLLRRGTTVARDLDHALWLDLVSPTEAERATVENLLEVELPTRDAMQEIEISSRLYSDDDAAFMTVTLPLKIGNQPPHMAHVSFVLTNGRLVTLRHHELDAFGRFLARAEQSGAGKTGETILAGILEAIVDGIADSLERASADVETLSRLVFEHDATKPTMSRDFQAVLRQLGRDGDLTSKLSSSLTTLDHLATFLHHGQAPADERMKARIDTLARDVVSLNGHAAFLSQKISFLLDATLGLIGIEQNAIIKIFSVAAVVFLPPTLIASIYGMNFRDMPELDWAPGYPLALLTMVLSAVLPYRYFKWRGWL